MGAVLLAALLTLSSNAQQSLPQGSTQNADCSDPLLAGSAGCNTQSQSNGLNSFSLGQSATTSTATQPRLADFYSDTTPMNGQQPVSPFSARPVPPEPLTEFQRFVASTSGVVLPVYGSDLFHNAPSTFAPLQSAPVPTDFVIGPDDELRVRVWGQISFQANLRVDRAGDIYLPRVGSVHVAGLQFGELDSHLRQAISRIYRNFDLTVNLGQIRSIQVYLAGQARRPGSYTVSSLSTLVDALFAAGGPSAQGSLRHIELRRNGTVVTIFDLYDLLIRGDKSGDAKLLPGDVIYIPPMGPQAAITGSIRVPAIYEVRPNESVGDLLAEAGGITAVASAARISIERIDDHHDRHAMDVAYDAPGLATTVADGDLLRINSIVPGYQKTVTLRGNVANPGRFAWHPGMRVSELIPDKESLVTRDYWWRRASLGLPAPEFEPLMANPNLRQPDQATSLARPGTQGYPYNQSWNKLDTQQMPPQIVNPQDTMNPVTQSLASSAVQDQSSPGMRNGGQPRGLDPDVDQSMGYSSSSRLGTNRQAVPRTQIRLLAPEIDWEYAAIERQNPSTLKSEIHAFDLGKLVLQGDTTQDLELQPGDVVTIFSEDDIHLPLAKQTKVVKLEGEFVHGGSYTAQPGETLQQLVERAGGLTPGAYLYGSQFTRESTRVLQQERIDEYVQTLQLQMQRGNIALAAGSMGSAAQLAEGAAAQSSEREMIARLQQLRATGRIVLEFKPNASGLSSIPNIKLENGDTFVIPPLPATVNVVGAVNTQNSFLFNQNRRVRDYLRLAGGPSRSADSRHSFVIRADGEVISRDNMSGVWNDSFANLRLNPGDTIIVPDKIVKPSVMRGILDWSQSFSQLAVGAAAINVLH